MSEEDPQPDPVEETAEEVPVEDPPEEQPEEPPKARRGRPKGSKNKPKVQVVSVEEEEEIEEVSEILGKQAAIAGFYSYGEIAPFFTSNECNLHNQTMTLTLISE